MALTPERIAELERLKAMMQPLATDAKRKAQAILNAEKGAGQPVKLPMDYKSKGGSARDKALAQFRKGTKAKERLYHGTGNLEGLTSFDPATTGKGLDQLGSGFYLSNDPEEASGYAGDFHAHSGRENPSPGVVAAHVNIKKPIRIGKKGMSLNDARVNLTHDQVKRIMEHAPNLRHPEESPLANHVDTSRGVTPQMIHDIAKLYTGNNLHALQNDIFPNDPTAYRQALHQTTGYDGVMKDFGNGRKHYVAWFPNQIKSAIGNRGTYDPNETDITKAKGGTISQDAMRLALMNKPTTPKVKKVKEPTNTVKAYKLFRVDPKRPGQLFPLFVDANTPVAMNQWVDAIEGSMANGKVKSKIGPLAYRPGWHAGDLPIATHIGEKSDPSLTAPDQRPANHAWAEVEMPNDIDWQSIANERGTNANGKLVPVKAHITDQLPKGGHYRYKTNPNMTGNWLIGGSMKVNRVLTDKEVEKINKAAGLSDLPRAQPFNKKAFGFDKGGSVPDSSPELVAEEMANYRDPKSTKINDWKWRKMKDVRKDMPIVEVPDYVQRGYGEFMNEQHNRAQAGQLSPRDLLKAFTITQSSIGRGGLPHATATKTGMKLPNTGGEVRPEGAFAEWLGSPMGQRYLDMAERGEIDPKVLMDIQRKFSPFGKQNQLADQMTYAANTMPAMAKKMNKAVTGSKDEYRDWAEQMKGVAGAKSGFVGSMIGRGDLPTLDARQLNLHTLPAKVGVGSIMNRGKGLGAREAVDRLIARQKAMDLKLDPALAKHYQHLAHHAVWDKVGNNQTTHDDIVKAMRGYAEGGQVNDTKENS